MGASVDSTPTLEEALRALRAATSRGAIGRAMIRAHNEGFLFREVCRAVVAAGYSACAVHENGRDPQTFSLVAASGVDAADSITLSEPPTDGKGNLPQQATGGADGDPLDAAVVRLVVRPAGGRVFLVSIHSRDSDAFEGEELLQLQELGRDIVAGMEALNARPESVPRRADRQLFGASDRARAPNKIETALRDQLEMIRSIADSVQDALVMIDDKGRISYWNPAAEQTFGWTAEEALGQPLHPMLAPDRFHEAIETGFSAFTATGEGAAIGKMVELSGLRKGGSEFPLELSLGRVRLRGTWQSVGIVRDITERKQVLDDLQRAKTDAEAAAEAKSLFLANMSHEIRTPLNAVIGMAGLLLDTDLNAEQQDFARIVHRSGEILLSVINDILDFSKMNAEALEFETIPFSIRSCVEDVGDLLAQKAAETDLELVILIDHEVPRRVAGDPGRLRQVLANLINNAIKFTETGEVVLKVDLAGADDEQRRLTFSVEDTGIGIPPDQLSDLFLPFTQVDSSTTRRFGGTGLGLSISKSLVERMGGSLEVESQVGKGTVFRFEAVFESAPDDDDAPPIRHGTLDKMTVLVVDDNKTNLRLLVELLGRWGCKTTTAANGQEALDLLHDPDGTTNFDLAILDFSMPVMDGAALAAAIRSNPLLAAMPLILLTSMPEFGDGARMKKAGFNAYLTKPVKQSYLYDAILAVTADPDTAPVSNDGAMVTRHTLNEARRSRLRILVAEDNEVNQKVTSRMLERLGYRCDLAENGQDALDALARSDYDVVFMDCQMPVMDGFEATRQIRLLEGENRRIEIIATTADALKGTRERCIESGMDGYISKPIDLDELAAVLERFGGSLTVDDSETPETDDEAPVEIARLQAIARGDRGFERRILLLYLEECDKRHEGIGRALEGENLEALRQEAHTLKGSSSNIGADSVAELAGRLQNAAETGERTLCGEILDSLLHESESTNRWLEAYVQELDSDPGVSADD